MFETKSVKCSFGCVGYSGNNMPAVRFGNISCSKLNLSAIHLDMLNVQGKICQLFFWMCWMFRGKSVSCCFGCVGCSGENLSAVLLYDQC